MNRPNSDELPPHLKRQFEMAMMSSNLNAQPNNESLLGGLKRARTSDQGFAAPNDAMNATDALRAHLLGASAQKAISIVDDEQQQHQKQKAIVMNATGMGNLKQHQQYSHSNDNDDNPDEISRRSNSNDNDNDNDNNDEATIGPNNTIRNTTGRKLSFPERLMELLNSPNCQDSMCWLPNGNAFALHPNVFMRNILPKHFDGTKFESFTRKLNRWGFKRIAGEDAPEDTFAYSHHLFKRDLPELCRGMSGGKKPEKDLMPVVRYRQQEQILAALGIDTQRLHMSQFLQLQNRADAAAASFPGGNNNNNIPMHQQLQHPAPFSAGAAASIVGTGATNEFLRAELLYRQQQENHQSQQNQAHQAYSAQIQSQLSRGGIPQQQQQQQMPPPYPPPPVQSFHQSMGGGGGGAHPQHQPHNNMDSFQAQIQKVSQQERLMQQMMQESAAATGNPFPMDQPLNEDEFQAMQMLLHQQNQRKQQQQQQQHDEQQQRLRLQQQLAFQQLQQQQSRNPQNNNNNSHNMRPPYM